MKAIGKTLGCGAIAAALAIGTSTVQAQVVNGGMENAGQFNAGNPIGLPGVGQGWSTDFGGNPPNQSSAQAHSGSFSLLAVNAAGNAWNPQGSYQIIANSSVGSPWTASLWAFTDTGTMGNDFSPNLVDFQINFLDSALAAIGGGQVETGWSPINALNTWQEYTLNGIIPAGTEYVSIYVMAMIGPNASGPVNVYFDDVSFSVIPEPSTFALAGMGGLAVLTMIRRRKS
ncbi:MAG TPA: PEP-CTERM sorting domain-containing protein [Verrucomicrobiota bacterium]|nr:PEP-CTERM sorting domain-containing protein [Verrucomicrobiota bacterium]